jgi:hypothetical protein
MRFGRRRKQGGKNATTDGSKDGSKDGSPEPARDGAREDARSRSANGQHDEPDTRDMLTRPSASSSNPLSHRFDVEEERATRILSGAPGDSPGEHDRTRILSHGNESRAVSSDRMEDPPAGWLVVIEGPGLAQQVTVGYGMNSIGRDAGQRIRLDFGDERISRQGHAMVSYDEKSRKFYVQHGGGPNLTYLRDEPLLTPRELVDCDVIRLGDTALMFRQLCGPDFDWLALSPSDGESES